VHLFTWPYNPKQSAHTLTHGQSI